MVLIPGSVNYQRNTQRGAKVVHLSATKDHVDWTVGVMNIGVLCVPL